jgi:hypothetical protein
VQYFSSSAPSLLALDNFETTWEPTTTRRGGGLSISVNRGPPLSTFGENCRVLHHSEIFIYPLSSPCEELNTLEELNGPGPFLAL